MYYFNTVQLYKTSYMSRVQIRAFIFNSAQNKQY